MMAALTRVERLRYRIAQLVFLIVCKGRPNTCPELWFLHPTPLREKIRQVFPFISL
jgi:hypothetical protein